MKRVNMRPAVILLVENDPGDQELTRRALEEDVLRTRLMIVDDGEAALDYLHRRGAYEQEESSPIPDLILMDLNMPKLDGRDVLPLIKADPRLRRIPVVIMTTSEQETDIVRSYELGCNSFITKPINVDNFIKTIRQLGDYWFEMVTLPRVEPENG